ncbi:MAG: acyltransferase family protein [Pirellulaceae bacterium]
MTSDILKTQTPLTIDRRHDLDALRAIAMLAGIALHGLLSFMPMPEGAWPVRDDFQSELFGVVMAAIHGFRMPLFFLISGFFTAMLWRKRGLRSLIHHRFKRIFLPLAIGMVTIIPLTWAAIIGVAIASAASNSAKPDNVDLYSMTTTVEAEKLWADADGELDLNQYDTRFQMPPITHAVIYGRPDITRWLIEKGADVNKRSGDGSVPLTSAVFFGRAESAKLLIDAGAALTSQNIRGDGLKEVMEAPWAFTAPIASLLSVEVDKTEVETGRAEIAKLIDWDQVESQTPVEEAGDGQIDKIVGTFVFLGMIPVFHHLWFLWFLCWLVAAFVVYAAFATRFPRAKLPEFVIVSPLRYAWLIPLTLLPQMFMGLLYPVFGPDTSSGIVPLPHLLFYYGIFFFFGALYFDCDDTEGRLGRNWKWTLPIALFVVFPLGYQLTLGGFGFGKEWLDPAWHRSVSVATQVIYVWLMTFGSVGFFRVFYSNESRTMRYVSDSSYWLYLVHLPVIMVAQYLVRHWQLPAIVKWSIVCVVVSGLLLLSYQWFIRYTPIGTLLNGRRQRPSKNSEPAVAIVAE